jgi:hypothetical protein
MDREGVGRDVGRSGQRQEEVGFCRSGRDGGQGAGLGRQV